MNETKEEQSPVLYVKILIIVIAIAAIISLVIKSINLVTTSTFKGDSFNILYTGDKNWLIHIDGSDKKIVFAPVDAKSIKGKDRIGKSVSSGILLDAVVYSDEDLSAKNFLTLGSFFKLISSKLENMNGYDLLKLYVSSKRIPTANRVEFDKLSEASSVDFADKKILDEQLSVAVINASEKDGVGSQFSKVLKSLGYNVVSVTSRDKEKSHITSNTQKSPSIDRLKSTLKLPVKTTDQKITDITVVVGEDLLK